MFPIPAYIPWQGGNASSPAGQALARQALSDMASANSPAEAYDKALPAVQTMANCQGGVDSTEFMLAKTTMQAAQQMSTPATGAALLVSLLANISAGASDNIGVAMARVGYLAMNPVGLPISPQDAAAMGLTFVKSITDCASYDDRAQASAVLDQCTGLQNYPGGAAHAADLLGNYLHQEASAYVL